MTDEDGDEDDEDGETYAGEDGECLRWSAYDEKGVDDHKTSNNFGSQRQHQTMNYNNCSSSKTNATVGMKILPPPTTSSASTSYTNVTQATPSSSSSSNSSGAALHKVSTIITPCRLASNGNPPWHDYSGALASGQLVYQKLLHHPVAKTFPKTLVNLCGPSYVTPQLLSSAITGGRNPKAALGRIFDGFACMGELLGSRSVPTQFSSEEERQSEEIVQNWRGIKDTESMHNFGCDATSEEDLLSALGASRDVYDANKANQLYKQQQYLGHYYYLARHHKAHEQGNVIAQEQKAENRRHTPTVLMIAEKPSIAKVLAEQLGPQGRQPWQRRNTVAKGIATFEYNGYFKEAGRNCRFVVTSTIGHLFRITFKQQKGLKPFGMYDAETVKELEDSSVKMRLPEHLQQLAAESDYLVLWLDCDREGENICYEVISLLRDQFPTDDNVYRAHFSAITGPALKEAVSTLKRPNKFLSMSVDARQELDLKVGCSFTRMLTWNFLKFAQLKFPKSELTVLSYGPCQTPTLYFCVQRHREIQNFQSVKWEQATFHYGQVEFLEGGAAEEENENDSSASGAGGGQHGKNNKGGGGKGGGHQGGKNRGSGGKNQGRHANATESRPSVTVNAVVSSVRQERKWIKKPPGLNTVNLLKAASKLGISPASAMKTAEELYSQGYISYPRTESTKYAPSFNVTEVARLFAGQDGHHGHSADVSRTLNALLQRNNGQIRPPSDGYDAGDHPPVTPMRAVWNRGDLKPKAYKLFDYVVRHFVASLHHNVEYTEYKVTSRLEDRRHSQLDFEAVFHSVPDRGFLSVMDHMGKFLKDAGRSTQLREGQRLHNVQLRFKEGWTEPPAYLTEGELVDLMDKNRIGTDASMAQHIENVVTRNYVVVCGPGQRGQKEAGPRILTKGMNKGKLKDHSWPASRHMVPTGLGLAVLDMFQRSVPALCEPDIRAYMERQCNMISEGNSSKESVVTENIEIFKEKFCQFEQNLDKIANILAPKPGSPGYDPNFRWQTSSLGAGGGILNVRNNNSNNSSSTRTNNKGGNSTTNIFGTSTSATTNTSTSTATGKNQYATSTSYNNAAAAGGGKGNLHSYNNTTSQPQAAVAAGTTSQSNSNSNKNHGGPSNANSSSSYSRPGPYGNASGQRLAAQSTARGYQGNQQHDYGPSSSPQNSRGKPQKGGGKESSSSSGGWQQQNNSDSTKAGKNSSGGGSGKDKDNNKGGKNSHNSTSKDHSRKDNKNNNKNDGGTGKNSKNNKGRDAGGRGKGGKKDDMVDPSATGSNNIPLGPRKDNLTLPTTSSSTSTSSGGNAAARNSTSYNNNSKNQYQTRQTGTRGAGGRPSPSPGRHAASSGSSLNAYPSRGTGTATTGGAGAGGSSSSNNRQNKNANTNTNSNNYTRNGSAPSQGYQHKNAQGHQPKRSSGWDVGPTAQQSNMTKSTSGAASASSSNHTTNSGTSNSTTKSNMMTGRGATQSSQQQTSSWAAAANATTSAGNGASTYNQQQQSWAPGAASSTPPHQQAAFQQQQAAYYQQQMAAYQQQLVALRQQQLQQQWTPEQMQMYAAGGGYGAGGQR
ncbi:unnamed protein product [Amoebophrya sp. A25]|nr:unnamed protein product [Amoebophrya sp. A25]|eukprot:GSA25T00023456001.1